MAVAITVCNKMLQKLNKIKKEQQNIRKTLAEAVQKQVAVITSKLKPKEEEIIERCEEQNGINRQEKGECTSSNVRLINGCHTLHPLQPAAGGTLGGVSVGGRLFPGDPDTGTCRTQAVHVYLHPQQQQELVNLRDTPDSTEQTQGMIETNQRGITSCRVL